MIQRKAISATPTQEVRLSPSNGSHSGRSAWSGVQQVVHAGRIRVGR
jgi:hypothetical protein